MFYVYMKSDTERKKYPVYQVWHKRGYPFFTIYKDGAWIVKSAKYFVPIENNKGD